MRIAFLLIAAAALLAGCSGGIPSSSTVFLGANATGVKVGQGATGAPEITIGDAAALTVISPNEGSNGERLSSVYKAGVGSANESSSEDMLSTFACRGSDSILGREADVGIDTIYATGNAAGYAARMSRCSVGE